MLCLHSDALAVSQAGSALAHGFAGDRFFPATILTDDPYVADEMSLPTVTVSPPAPDGSQSINISPSISKRITPDIGIILTDQWERLQPPRLPAVSGLGGTLSAQLQYQLFINAPHQAIALVGVNAGFGRTGRVQALGAPDFTTCLR